MPKILINLLPEELKALEKQKAKIKLITKATVAVMVVVIAVVLVILSQSLLLKTKQDKLSSNILQAEQRVTSLNQQEGYLLLLKKRLAGIQTLSTSGLEVTDRYNLILSLMPPSVTIKTLNVTGAPEISLNGSAADVNGFNNLLENLTYSSKHKDKIAKVNLQNLIKNQDGVFVFEMKITLR